MTTVQNLDPASLTEAERNAFAILWHVSPDDLAALKHDMDIGIPTTIGPQTVTAFAALCLARGLDLSDAGVSAFKVLHQLGDTGPNHGAIGSQTATTYFDAIHASAPPAPTPGRHVTARGVAVVENFEGLELSAYRDSVGVATIGYGHTNGVRMGQTITREQADAFLRSDLTWAEHAVCSDVTAPLNDNQFDALVSFTFNCGAGALAGSTLLRKLNAGDYPGAADAFLSWVNGDHGPLPGLVARRNEERGLFLRPV
jgi:GH24 family phage-related lysozyme (muramidase)